MLQAARFTQESQVCFSVSKGWLADVTAGEGEREEEGKGEEGRSRSGGTGARTKVTSLVGGGCWTVSERECHTAADEPALEVLLRYFVTRCFFLFF